MSRISRFKVGLFVLICTGLAMGLLLWLGAAQVFQKTKTYVSYFNEAVDGLNRGAPVAFLGVTVGKVDSVRLAPGQNLIEVRMDLDPDFKVDASMAIEIMLRGITGQKFLAITRAPADLMEVTPEIPFPVTLPLIRSRPGQITRIEAALKKVYSRIESVDVGALVSGWTETARDASALLSDREIRETLQNVREITADLKTLTGSLSEPGNSEQWEKAFKNLAEASESTRKASEVLASQLQSLPASSFGNLAKRVDRVVGTGEKSIGAVNDELSQSFVMLRQSLFQVNQVLIELKGLIGSLREAPGRVLTQPRSSEPFKR